MLTFSKLAPDKLTSSNSDPERSLRVTVKRSFCPSIFIALLRRDHDWLGMRVRGILVDAFLDLVTEMRDQALDRPGRGVAERADGVAFDLLGHFEQHVDLALLRAALRHAGQHAPHPAGALAARRALAAAFVLIEVGEPRDGADQVGRLVHDDDRRRAE